MAAVRFTVRGASGFIGSHVARHLKAKGYEVYTPARGDDLKTKRLGHIIDATGVVGSAIDRQADMLEAHVTLTQRLLSNTTFESFLYISSTRLYGLVKDADASETTLLPFAPSGHAVFDASKLLGECVCLSFDNLSIRVARLSNTYGKGMTSRTFLGFLLSELKEKGAVTIGESPESSKDYISIDDVVKSFENIALTGKERLYNVASGKITTHRQIADKLQNFGAITFADKAPTRIFPRIDTSRMFREFGLPCRDLTDDLSSLFQPNL